MKTLTVFLVLALALTAAAFCPRNNKAHAPVEVSLTSLTAPENTDVTLHRLHAATAAHVWEVYVQEGSHVTRGQVLAKLAVPLNTVARQQAQANVAKAQQQLTALAATANPDAALVAQAQQRVTEAGARLAGTPKQVTFAFVQAPADGIIVGQPVAAGTRVSDTTAVAVLAQPNVVPTAALTAN
ncbi:biotin/lipoyl-binding protein [Hymenobacter koreensis]|uniref:Biotin/lipoyl-binding protein n=1 Tax=Hymenobacter koreensis TaxID=1084523 RepID=A0ABP8IYW1_9BACT